MSQASNGSTHNATARNNAVAWTAAPENTTPEEALAFRAAADAVLAAPVPMLLLWGERLLLYYNDACRDAVSYVPEPGRPVEEWPAFWEGARLPLLAALHTGASGTVEQFALPPMGNGSHPALVALHYGPVRGVHGAIAGLSCTLLQPAPHKAPAAPPVLDRRAASAREYGVIYDHLAEVVFNVAVQAGEVFRFISVNRAFYDATGLAPAAVIGRRIEEVIPQPSLDLVLGNYRRAIAQRGTVTWDEHTQYPSGEKVGRVTVRPVFDEAGRCTNLVGIVHDITALQRSQARLREANRVLEEANAAQHRLAADLHASEERLQMALESSAEGVWDWKVGNPQAYFSGRWREIAGCGGESSADDMRLWTRRIHPDDYRGAMHALHRCLGGQLPVFIHEHRLAHPERGWLWIRAHGKVTVRGEDGAARRVVGTIADITEEMQLKQKLEQSHALLSDLAMQVPGALFQFVLRPDGACVCQFMSSGAADIFHLPAGRIEADCRVLWDVVHPDDRTHLLRAMQHCSAAMQSAHVEFRTLGQDGEEHWREIAAKPARLDNGDVLWHGFVSDISERKRTERTIREFNVLLDRRAHYDALTGLPNRVLFRERLEHAIHFAQETGGKFALLFIDLDEFKAINDLLGHGAGDSLLVQAARRIESCLRASDTVARLGGDEFTVILAAAPDSAHVEAVAHKILAVLAQPFRLDTEHVTISGSIGITIHPDDGSLPEDLMRYADQAMYLAKSSGKNQVRFFETAMHTAAISRLKIIADLREALALDQFELFFQPVLDIARNRIEKAEALLRWHRPGYGMVMPGDFIHIAEETGLIHELGNWIFTQAAHWSQYLSSELGTPFQVSFNKSPLQFQNRGHGMNWIEYLERMGIRKDQVSVEITEGVLLNPSDAVYAKLNELQDGGVEVSIDDFGTGYSSMSYLKRLHIDYLKIDQSFIAEMLSDAAAATITETIIVMAHKLGLRVIAEGVETAAQLAWLREHGCDFAQGYLIAHPLPLAELRAMLATRQEPSRPA
jgi:diguanylate cyclase (GGDEF)-like protein/PAS domain S-box-containing protein